MNNLVQFHVNSDSVVIESPGQVTARSGIGLGKIFTDFRYYNPYIQYHLLERISLTRREFMSVGVEYTHRPAFNVSFGCQWMLNLPISATIEPSFNVTIDTSEEMFYVKPGFNFCFTF